MKGRVHDPIAPVCLLVGTVRSSDAASTACLLHELADRYQLGEHVLLKGLPHWAVASAAGDLDVACFFRSAHAAALERGLAIDDDIEELIPSLHRLRLDAQQEVHRQFQEAMRDGLAAASGQHVRGKTTRVPDVEAYERWYHVVSDPDHVTTVSAHFLDCWNAAKRFQRSANANA